jgi:preprotein translocase subunit SecE
MAPVKDTSKKPAKREVDKTDKKPRPTESTESPVDRIKNYLKGVQSEWHKVSWPTWPQIWGQTIVVLVMVSIMTVGLSLIDNSLYQLIRLITPQHS